MRRITHKDCSKYGKGHVQLMGFKPRLLNVQFQPVMLAVTFKDVTNAENFSR